MNNFTIVRDDLLLRKVLKIVKSANRDAAKKSATMRREINVWYLRMKIAFHKKNIESMTIKGDITLEKIAIERLELKLANLLK